ncbi:MAG: DUF11 domain-containing protein [Nitrospirae bacterium]|nr:DUF11 domain-containing protein [Nitrospirota bacterium]
MRKTLLAIVTFLLLVPSVALAVTNYTDPANYPGAWPATDLTWIPYGYDGVSTKDITGNPDPSRGASLAGIVDVSSGMDPEKQFASSFIWGDGYNVFFRYRLEKSPLASSQTGPIAPGTWVVMMDTNSDGAWDFAFYIYSKDQQDAEPYDIRVEFNRKKVETVNPQTLGTNTITLWRQDSASRNWPPNNFVDGETGRKTDWDKNPDADIWDFGRIRITENIYAGSVEAYLDIQVPIEAIDATMYTYLDGTPGPKMTPTGWFQYGFSTADSGTDPAQKDYVYDGCFAPTVASAYPFGDNINSLGQISEKPIMSTAVSSTTCGSAVTVKTYAQDTHDTTPECTSGCSGGACSGVTATVITTVTSVKFYYYIDVDGNGAPNDGQSWMYFSDATAPAAGTGYWTATWDTTLLPNAKLLLKTVVTDSQGNSTDSIDDDPGSPTYNPATGSGVGPIYGSMDNTTCGAPGKYITGYVYNDDDRDMTKDAVETGIGVASYVKLVNSSGTAIKYGTVDPVTGYYYIAGVTTGQNYTLIEDDNSSLADATPNDPAPWNSTTPNTISITNLQANQIDQNFGDVLGVQVSGYIYNDANHDKIRETAEGGVGVTTYAKLIDGSNNVVGTALADTSTGLYTLTGVGPGTYTIIEDDNNNTADKTATDPSGWASTTSNTLTVTVATTPVTDQNFGDYRGSRISGSVFEDKGDGTAGSAQANDAVYDTPTEKGIADVTVRACSNAACAVTYDTTATAADGTYSLYVPYTASGTTVYVLETDRGGYLSTGSAKAAVVQYGAASTTALRNTITVAVTAGTSYADNNFGDVGRLAIFTDQSYTVSAGDGVMIRHTLTLRTPGKVSIMLASTKAWSYAVYDDSDCEGTPDGAALSPSAGYYALSGGAALPVGTYCIVLNTSVSTGTPDGTVEKLVVMADEDWTNAANPDGDTGTAYDDSGAFNTDTITVNKSIGGMLRLEKWVRNVTTAEGFNKSNSANPCEELEYKIDYKNLGASPVLSVVVSDIVPSGTTLLEDRYSLNTMDAEVTLDGSTLYGQINDGPDTDGLTYTSRTIKLDMLKMFTRTQLLPGEEGYLKYRVRVDCQ